MAAVRRRFENTTETQLAVGIDPEKWLRDGSKRGRVIA